MSFPTPSELNTPVTLEDYLIIIKSMMQNSTAWPMRIVLNAPTEMQTQVAEELTKSEWTCRIFARYIFIEPMKG